MKKILSILLAVILLTALTACGNTQTTEKDSQNNTNESYIQNLFSGMTEMSEVKSYFDKSLGLEINTLYCFRLYELDQNMVLIQYKSTSESPYGYLLYGMGTRNSLFPPIGLLNPLTEASSSQLDNGYTLSELRITKHADEAGDFGAYHIIAANDGRIVRFIANSSYVFTFGYDNDQSISAVNLFVKEDINDGSVGFSEDALYDINYRFEEENCSQFSHTHYSYNTDGAADQITYELHLKGVNSGNGNNEYIEQARFEFHYDANGFRTSGIMYLPDENQRIYKFERDEKGLVQRITEHLSEDDEGKSYNISYGSDGLMITNEYEIN